MKPQSRLVPAGRIKLTYAEYLELPDDGKQYEILDGELEVHPAPVPRHQAVSRNLQRILDRHVTERRLGQIFDAPIDVVLSDTTVVQPDLLFLTRRQNHLIGERAIEGPPTLVVEILSPGSRRRDRITKSALHARFGIPHYWVVDPDARVFELYELRDDAYALIDTRRGRGRVRPALFPGLEIPLSAVWA